MYTHILMAMHGVGYTSKTIYNLFWCCQGFLKQTAFGHQGLYNHLSLSLLAECCMFCAASAIVSACMYVYMCV